MKVSKWVDMGQVVEIEIGMDDIRAAITECCVLVTEDRLGEPGPKRSEVIMALDSIASFLRALTNEHIQLLVEPSRKLVANFLHEQAKRFEPPNSTS